MNRAHLLFGATTLAGIAAFVACSSSDSSTPADTDAGAEGGDETPVVSSSSSSSSSSSGGPGLDAAVPACHDTDPFDTIEPLGLVNTPADDLGPTLLADESQLLFATSKFSDAAAPEVDLEFAGLADGGVFASPATPDPTTFELNGATLQNQSPTITALGGDVVYVQVQNLDGGQTSTLMTAHRSDAVSAFGKPTALAAAGIDASVATSPFLVSSPDGVSAIYVTIGGVVYRAPAAGLTGIGTLVPVTTNGAPLAGQAVVATLDEGALYVGIVNQGHIAVEVFTQKGDAGVSYEDPGADLAINADGTDTIPRWLSPDHCRLYLTSNRPSPTDAGGGYDIYVAKRHPQ